jgi:hypothetical protein
MKRIHRTHQRAVGEPTAFAIGGDDEGHGGRVAWGVIGSAEHWSGPA